MPENAWGKTRRVGLKFTNPLLPGRRSNHVSPSLCQDPPAKETAVVLHTKMPSALHALPSMSGGLTALSLHETRPQAQDDKINYADSMK